MIRKKYGVDFHSRGGALTLNPDEVCSGDLHKSVRKESTRTHDSGWTITGFISEDYLLWVNFFKATHETYGEVSGDFEDEVVADSPEAFDHFWKHHEPEAWDYYDI